MHGLFRWSSKWWPGVIPLVVLWAIAAWTSTVPLEADLAPAVPPRSRTPCWTRPGSRSTAATSPLPPTRSPKTAAASAVASVEAVPGVRLVNDETRLVPEAKPFVWSAERDVVRVTLAAVAPLPASKGS